MHVPYEEAHANSWLPQFVFLAATIGAAHPALRVLTRRFQVQLKSQYEEKMIRFSSSSASRAPTCTVSESQLRQSLTEAKEEIQALKEQKKQMVCVRLRRFLFAPCRCVVYAASEI